MRASTPGPRERPARRVAALVAACLTACSGARGPWRGRAVPHVWGPSLRGDPVLVAETPAGLRHIVWGGVRATYERGAYTVSREGFARPIARVAQVGARWAFVSRDGVVAVSDTFAGPLRRLGEIDLPGSPRADVGALARATSGRGRLALVDRRHVLWSSDGVAPLARVSALDVPVVAAGFLDMERGVALDDRRVVHMSGDAGGSWRDPFASPALRYDDITTELDAVVLQHAPFDEMLLTMEHTRMRVRDLDASPDAPPLDAVARHALRSALAAQHPTWHALLPDEPASQRWMPAPFGTECEGLRPSMPFHGPDLASVLDRPETDPRQRPTLCVRVSTGERWRSLETPLPLRDAQVRAMRDGRALVEVQPDPEGPRRTVMLDLETMAFAPLSVDGVAAGGAWSLRAAQWHDDGRVTAVFSCEGRSGLSVAQGTPVAPLALRPLPPSAVAAGFMDSSRGVAVDAARRAYWLTLDGAKSWSLIAPGSDMPATWLPPEGAVSLRCTSAGCAVDEALWIDGSGRDLAEPPPWSARAERARETLAPPQPIVPRCARGGPAPSPWRFEGAARGSVRARSDGLVHTQVDGTRLRVAWRIAPGRAPGSLPSTVAPEERGELEVPLPVAPWNQQVRVRALLSQGVLLDACASPQRCQLMVPQDDGLRAVFAPMVDRDPDAPERWVVNRDPQGDYVLSSSRGAEGGTSRRVLQLSARAHPVSGRTLAAPDAPALLGVGRLRAIGGMLAVIGDGLPVFTRVFEYDRSGPVALPHLLPRLIPCEGFAGYDAFEVSWNPAEVSLDGASQRLRDTVVTLVLNDVGWCVLRVAGTLGDATVQLSAADRGGYAGFLDDGETRTPLVCAGDAAR